MPINNKLRITSIDIVDRTCAARETFVVGRSGQFKKVLLSQSETASPQVAKLKTHKVESETAKPRPRKEALP